ncbi:MAG: heparan-alpha-glucosaminide N-acetyltransferase domain-containing protein [bacterium]
MSHPPGADRSASNPRARIESVDIVRGIIMIIMALDHTRDFFGNAGISPTNLAQTTTALFFTRWITHLCAPVFFLLTGTGAYLSLRRMSRAELSRFLITRGLWMIVLEVTALRFIMQFNVDYRTTMLTVLWALGCAMIGLGVLVRLPTSVITIVGVAMIATHNLLDFIPPAQLGSVVRFLHSPSMVSANPNHFVFQAYPIIPWVGVTALGFGFGQLFEWSSDRRRKTLLLLGSGMITAFVALRALNVYGDPSRWSVQKTPEFTALSFLNVTKYPPSLLFLLVTLGIAFLMLRAVDSSTPRLLRPALILGRVPLFYFLLHFAVIHVLAVVVCLIRFGSAHWMFESPSLDKFPITQPPGWPVSIPLVYLAWVSVVLIVYPFCRWFAALRAGRKDWWLSYL